MMKKIWPIFCIVVMATSCTVAKHADNGHVKGNDKKRNYYSEKLGINLSREYNSTLIQEVISWLGTPYAYGGKGKTGTDCSGFVMQVYKTVYNVATARSANGIYEQCTKVKK